VAPKRQQAGELGRSAVKCGGDMHIKLREFVFAVAAACVLLAPVNKILLSQQASGPNPAGKGPSATGPRLYNSSCAGCHGLDGHGSDKGANIAENMKLRNLPDAQLAEIISGGVPGTGMPAFSSLSATQVHAVVDYVRALQGKGNAQVLGGDPKRGKEIFFGKGTCSTCHAISGEGGFLGPDLSSYAYGASAAAVREEVTKSRRIPPYGYRAATLTEHDGSQLQGLIRNEDNFSIQFQSTDGAFHFLQKTELQNLNRRETSLMPSDFGERLTRDELNNLVAYLMTSAEKAGPAGKSDRKKDDVEW
jgi:cytochrome c oxidase cbb3-type subunit III